MNSFDPATHAYTIDGRPVPSVTQVLRDLIPGWSASDWHMQRGQAVHACAALIAQGKEFEHDPAIDGQVRALRRFFAEVKPPVIVVENAVYSLAYQYAGRFDLLSVVKGVNCVIDFKSTLTPSVPYQCAAYSIAWGESAGTSEPGAGLGVQIHDDGTYKLSEVYSLRRYKQGWLSLLTAYNIRRQCGIKTTNEEAV